MNTAQLKNFISLANNGSFSKTEKTEYISKQALYKQINSLEKELGFSLFKRSSSGIELTDSGKKFLEGTKTILADLNKLIEDCQDSSFEQSKIRISEVEHQQLLKPVIEAFGTKYPDIHFKSVIHPNRSGEFRVANNITDIGETFKNPIILNDKKLSYHPLTSFPYVIVMDPGHPLAKKEEVDLTECAKYKTTIYKNMFPQEFISELKTIYPEKNLLMRSDVDNHIKTAYRCKNTRQLFLTFNPFVYSLQDLHIVKIKGSYSQEYGIITSINPSKTVAAFVKFAIKFYQAK